MGKGYTKSYHRILNQDYVKGTLTCLKPSTIKRVINLEFPNILNIEPTNECSLKCYYCPRERAAKGSGYMDWDIYRRIIDEAVGYKKLIMLNLHKDGEPFLHPRFMDMIRYAKKRDIAKTIHVNTNALCWTDRVIDELLDSGIDDITISLDAARAITYKKHKGVDCLKKVEGQIYRFFEKRKALGLKRPFVRVKIMEFEQISKEEMKEFFSKWEGIADMVQVTGIHNWSGEIRGVNITDETSRQRYPCVIVWYVLVVNWNGEVTVCSVDWNTQIKVGDVRKQDLHHIWNSPEIKEARRAHLERKLRAYPCCRKCVIWVSIGDLTNWLKGKKEFYA